MMFFYIGAVALVVLGVVFALWPFIKYHFFNTDNTNADTVGRQAINVALYRDHLTDLENSLAQGNIDQTQFDQLKQELERNLLEDSLERNKSLQQNSKAESKLSTAEYAPKSSRQHIPMFIGMMILVPIMSFFTYQWLGNSHGWELKEQLEAQTALENQLIASNGNPELEKELSNLNRQIVSGLEAHVANRPDDLDSLVLLARNAVATGQYEVAITHYQKVLEAQPQAAQIMAELAQTIFIQANNRAVPVVGMLAERALGIQPNNPMALGLMGIFTFQSGSYEQAIRHWEQAVAVYPPNSPNAQALQNGIAQARSRLSENPDVAANNDQQADSQTQEQPQDAAAVKVAVSLAKDVPVKPEYTVFIYARAWQGAKIPLAITKVQASELPLTLKLDDSMAMAPGMNLSSAEQVEIIARLSPSGNAIAQAGDWQATLGPIKPDVASATVYPLIISQPLAN